MFFDAELRPAEVLMINYLDVKTLAIRLESFFPSPSRNGANLVEYTLCRCVGFHHSGLKTVITRSLRAIVTCCGAEFFHTAPFIALNHALPKYLSAFCRDIVTALIDE